MHQQRYWLKGCDACPRGLSLEASPARGVKFRNLASQNHIIWLWLRESGLSSKIESSTIHVSFVPPP